MAFENGQKDLYGLERLEGNVEQIVFCNEDNGYTVCDMSTEDDIFTVCGIGQFLRPSGKGFHLSHHTPSCRFWQTDCTVFPRNPLCKNALYYLTVARENGILYSYNYMIGECGFYEIIPCTVSCRKPPLRGRL